MRRWPPHITSTSLKSHLECQCVSWRCCLLWGSVNLNIRPLSLQTSKVCGVWCLHVGTRSTQGQPLPGQRPVLHRCPVRVDVASGCSDHLLLSVPVPLRLPLLLPLHPFLTLALHLQPEREREGGMGGLKEAQLHRDNPHKATVTFPIYTCL